MDWRERLRSGLRDWIVKGWGFWGFFWVWDWMMMTVLMINESMTTMMKIPKGLLEVRFWISKGSGAETCFLAGYEEDASL
jgi:hypothetical protein